ncbi:hypothetical protein GD627_11825 [Arthrobacter yangruifuii]|uniref:Uncharacterized protein n=1 Tax=Arthrobacter yangruifuii TaxID=2606616 RepID=A0A5N6MFB6_9MICC|nr:hypothetical protein [Arthrobacter yangruifuii]KAD3514994.1 hypothetical protein GD627_11825 [Arthrobacter yangruifuii]
MELPRPRGLHNLGLGGSALVDPFTAQVVHPLPDALHPDSATHRLIGERFAKYAFAGEGPFAQRG